MGKVTWKRLTFREGVYTKTVPNIEKGQEYVQVRGIMFDKDGKLVGDKETEEPLRALEIEVLQGIAVAVQSTEKDIEKFNTAQAIWAELRDLPEGQMYIDLYEEDVKLLKEGFGNTVGRREQSWIEHGGPIIKQVASPQDRPKEDDSDGLTQRSDDGNERQEEA